MYSRHSNFNLDFNYYSSFQEKDHFDETFGGHLTEEDIKMNYEENYISVATASLGCVQTMMLIHDYTRIWISCHLNEVHILLVLLIIHM